jgi:hydroxymethylglutaryl-CoA lyase
MPQPPSFVRVYEVGPRDGLQNESAFIPTEHKIQLIQALLSAGLPTVEMTSFVHPRWIPALADADRVAGEFKGGLFKNHLTALVPNQRGLNRALEADCKEIAVFMSASQTHNQRNINKTKEETYTTFKPLFKTCLDADIRVRAYVSTVWGCPYEGQVPIEQTLDVIQNLLDLGAYEISLGDTIGVGNPRQTEEILSALNQKIPFSKLALHMHDTWGRALANCLVGLQMGIRTFDASIGGLGGCPYAPGASGNLATEDLVALLHEMGYETGIDFNALVKAGGLAQTLLERPLPSKALQASLAHSSSC